MVYDELRLQRAAYRPLHDAVLVQSGGLDPGVVVDLGCGTGRLLSLERRGSEVAPRRSCTGVDAFTSRPPR